MQEFPMTMRAAAGEGRRLSPQGHNVRQMPVEYIRLFDKSNKNDDRAFEAIAESDNAIRTSKRGSPTR
jgi:hypothetical protein